MQATGFNHISIHADDLETSVEFYEEVFGLERIPTYDFSIPVQYFRCGDRQLHIFERETSSPEYHHIALDVDDFEAVYRTARDRGIFDDVRGDADGFLFELPDGAVQLYLRDPAGNLVEVNWPDVTTLDRSIVSNIVRREDQVDQSKTALQASLYMDRNGRSE